MTGVTALYPATCSSEAGFHRIATLEEERRELFDAVLQSIRVEEPDSDHRAACAYLLRHLARTEPQR